jgi:hypothetical protein
MVNSQEDRIRKALGLANGPLPQVRFTLLVKYFDYLTVNLTFPFDAQLTEEMGFYRQLVYSQVKTLALVYPRDESAQEYSGLNCSVLKTSQQIEVPLVDLEVDYVHPNSQLLEDYWYWIWNWRFDPKI